MPEALWRAAAGRAARGARQVLDRQKVNGLKLAAGVLGPKASAALVAARLDLGNYRPGRPTILCLTRPHFSLDVEQLRKLDHVNWLGLNLIMLGEMQRAWAEPQMQQQTYYQRTRNDVHFRESWQRLDQFGREVLERIARRCRLDGLLCANIDYWQAEGLRRAAHELDLPFLVLSRENLLTRYDERLILERYNGFRFEGQAVAVFGDWMRRTLVRTGCIGERQIVVTGAPRLDVWNAALGLPAARDCIVLISFADPNYYAPEAFRATLECFTAAARRNVGKARFVVKAKNTEDRLAIYGICPRIPDSLEVRSDVALEELLPRARLVVGFNSMAMFDALFTSVPLATPDMMDTRRSNDYLMFEPDDALCANVLRFYRNPAELDELLDVAASCAAAPDANAEERRRLIQRYVHFPEGESATQAVERFVLEHIRRPS